MWCVARMGEMRNACTQFIKESQKVTHHWEYLGFHDWTVLK